MMVIAKLARRRKQTFSYLSNFAAKIVIVGDQQPNTLRLRDPSH